MVLKSIHLLYKKTMDDKGAHIEHLCYECWASKEVNPSSEGFLQAPRSTSKRRCVCPGRCGPQIVVERVQCPEVTDGFEIHQTALTMVESDRWAQRSVYDVSKFVATG